MKHSARALDLRAGKRDPCWHQEWAVIKYLNVLNVPFAKLQPGEGPVALVRVLVGIAGRNRAGTSIV